MVSVAQLVRVPDCGSGGCEFDSRHSPHFFDGSLAQLAEHLTLNQGVTGSIPVRSTIFLNWIASFVWIVSSTGRASDS